MIKSPKTSHFFEQLAMMFHGHSTELGISALAMTHLNASEKEIEQLESKAAKWDDSQTQKYIKLGMAVEMAFNNYMFLATMVEPMMDDCESLLKWHEELQKVNSSV